jgi:uncharacterized protein YegP (UPF0339 family)
LRWQPIAKLLCEFLDAIFGDCLQEMRFEIYEDKNRKWRWKLRFSNRTLVAESALCYENMELCKTGIQLVKEHAKDASIVIIEDNHTIWQDNRDSDSSQN